MKMMIFSYITLMLTDCIRILIITLCSKWNLCNKSLTFKKVTFSISIRHFVLFLHYTQKANDNNELRKTFFFFTAFSNYSLKCKHGKKHWVLIQQDKNNVCIRSSTLKTLSISHRSLNICLLNIFCLHIHYKKKVIIEIQYS